MQQNIVFIILLIYAVINLFGVLIMSAEYKGERIKRIFRRFFVMPYRNGITVGDVGSLLLLLPAIVCLLFSFGSFPAIINILEYIINIRLTKGRPAKSSYDLAQEASRKSYDKEYGGGVK